MKPGLRWELTDSLKAVGFFCSALWTDFPMENPLQIDPSRLRPSIFDEQHFDESESLESSE
jgi:hypothetical protein